MILVAKVNLTKEVISQNAHIAVNSSSKGSYRMLLSLLRLLVDWEIVFRCGLTHMHCVLETECYALLPYYGYCLYLARIRRTTNGTIVGERSIRCRKVFPAIVSQPKHFLCAPLVLVHNRCPSPPISLQSKNALLCQFGFLENRLQVQQYF
jgi:hypothetical protein